MQVHTKKLLRSNKPDYTSEQELTPAASAAVVKNEDSLPALAEAESIYSPIPADVHVLATSSLPLQTPNAPVAKLVSDLITAMPSDALSNPTNRQYHCSNFAE